MARFAANRYRFPGVEIKARLFRQYPHGDLASHVIGYIGRINPKDQEKLAELEVEANYRGTDFIGKAGLEASYQQELHGTTGFEQVEIDAAGRGIRTLARTPAQAGNNITLTLDIKLQEVAEVAFGERRGALVAIEPSTGGVLALRLQARLRPEPVRRRHRSAELGGAEQLAGPAAQQPRHRRASTRRARPSSPSWRWRRWNWASARRKARSTTRATSSSAAGASATPSPAATATSTCTSRS